MDWTKMPETDIIIQWGQLWSNQDVPFMFITKITLEVVMKNMKDQQSLVGLVVLFLVLKHLYSVIYDKHRFRKNCGGLSVIEGTGTAKFIDGPRIRNQSEVRKSPDMVHTISRINAIQID